MTPKTTDTIHAEPAISRDGSVSWIAYGTAGGIPFAAEADSEPRAMAEAIDLVFDLHVLRRLRLLCGQKIVEVIR